MRPSVLLRYSPLTVAAVGTLIAVLESVAIALFAFWLIELPAAKVFNALVITVLCPTLIAPPMIYFHCLAVHRGERARQELAVANEKLEAALREVRELTGLLPICAWCHKVREDDGYWTKVDAFLQSHTRAEITHSICPDCSERVFPKIPLTPTPDCPP